MIELSHLPHADFHLPESRLEFSPILPYLSTDSFLQAGVWVSDSFNT